MKKKNILSNVTMIDRFTQSEKDLVKGGCNYGGKRAKRRFW